MASTGIEHDRIDVWGNALAVASGLATPAQAASIFEYVGIQAPASLGQHSPFYGAEI